MTFYAGSQELRVCLCVCLVYKILWGFFRDDETRGDLSEQLKETYGTLRELQLHLRFFNLVFANPLWKFKILLLTMTVLFGFSTIRLIHTNPMLGCIYIYGGLCSTTTYIGIFQFAHQITEKAEGLKMMMEMKSGRLVGPAERKYWARVMKSVPRMGMSMGGFHRVEREAVPIYIDFSVNQIVSILISFN